MKSPNALLHVLCIAKTCSLSFFQKNLILFVLLFSSYSLYSQQLAFPTAAGFGKHATGGRGGSVIKVTNLNASGSGSLKAALEASGTRTVVFEVGGTIDLAGTNIYADDGNLTIAGQTAPGDGILVKGGQIRFAGSNVICRYLRVRPGAGEGSSYDGINITSENGTLVQNIIIDHCSISWAKDENFAIQSQSGSNPIANVTLQNSIVSECTYGSLSNINTSNLTFYRNLFAFNSERNIENQAYSNTTLAYESINNIYYGFSRGGNTYLGTKFTSVNNKYKLSSQISFQSDACISEESGGTPSQTHAYISGNIYPNGVAGYSSAFNPYIKTTPYISSGITPISASALEADILGTVGCGINRDAVDTRIINLYTNGNGTLATSGTYPTINGGTAPADSDNDGMPNTWEIANGLNPNNASDRNIVQADGYTNLEYYLNGMTLGVTGITADAGQDVSICQGSGTTLTATGGSTYQWSTGATTASITVSPNTTTTYTVTAFDATGNNSDTDDVTVTVNPIPNVNAGLDVTITVGTSVTLTATGANSYLWSTGSTSQSINVSPLSITTYTVTGTTNGCEDTDSVTVFLIDTNVNANAGNDVSICEGGSTTLTATGGFNYQWSTGATTESITVSPNTTTTYTVTAFGLLGINSDTDDVTVTVNPLPGIDAGANVTINLGESTTLSATGGDSYQWNTGATTASIDVSPSSTTTYTVTGTSNGCDATDTVTVTVIDTSVTAHAGADVSICEGSSATLTATGGSTYEWSTGETTASITVSPDATTTYTVTAFDATGTNSDMDDVTVTVNPTPIANAGNDVSTCRGTSVTLTASGGDTYLWETGATTASITVNPGNTRTYTVEVTQNGCTATDDVTVTVNPLPGIDAGANVTLNLGDSVTLSATGGNSYQWNTGATTASIDVSPSSTTTYTVTGTSNGCDATDTVTVTVIDTSVTANAGADVSICEGSSATLTATGGSTYEWSTGETTASITVSPDATTTYTVTAFDATGTNSDTDEVMVTVNPTPIANAGNDVSTCRGTSVTLTASGGDTYLWETGATTASITVNPGNTRTYTVEVTQNGCTATDDVTVTVNPLPSIDAGANVTINLGESVTLTATGGNSYQWSTGETTPSITVSPVSTTSYTVIGTNDNGCSRSDIVSVTVLTGNDVTADAGADVSICEGSSTTLSATGGSTYEWSTGETTASITVSPDATTTYTVTAFDATGTNSDTDEVTVMVNPLPTVTAGPNVTINIGESTTLTAMGASSYVWSTGATTQTITVSPNTTMTYTVIGTSNGCESSTSVTVTVLTGNGVTANAGADVSICEGNTTTLTASGGATYEWSTGETTASITVSPDATTTFTVIAFDATGTNSATDDVTVTVNPLPSIDAGANVTINLGDSVTLTATGGNSYQWNTGATTASIDVNPSSTTTYTVTGTSNGCESSASVTVTVLTGNGVTANAGADVSICEGNTTTLTASGGATYEWSTGETTASITVSPDATTTYTVTAFDATGTNSDTDEVTVSVNAAPVLYVSPDFTINSGQIVILYAFGANSYSWSTGQTGHFVLLFPTETTTYTVTGTNTNGCQTTASVTITVANGSSFPGNAGFDKTTCSGYGVTLTANGGDTYLWSTGETTQSINVNPNSTTTYSVVAYTSAAEITDEVTVHVNPNPVVHITNGEDVTILQGEYVTLSATGANRYEWNNGATLANIAVNPDETTTFSVTGYIQDCSDTKDITVNVVPQVVAFAGDNQSICLNESVTLTASGGDEFLWNTGETTPSITVSPSETTEYSVTVYNDLDYDTAEVLVTVQDCSVTDETPEDAEPFEFLVYPNPTSGSLNVKISGKLKVSNITLYDLSGKAIYHEVITDTEQLGFEKTLDLSNYSDGLYLLKLVDNGYAITKKIVVHR